MAAEHRKVLDVPMNINEEYYQISGEILSSFPKFRPPVDLFRFREDIAVLAPEAVPTPGAGAVLAGNALAAYADRLPAALQALPRIAALPSADALLNLAPALLAAGAAVPAEQALPLYIRDKVAQTTAERSAAGLAR